MSEHKIAIITDSSAYIPENALAGLNISVIPLWLLWEGENLRDGIDISVVAEGMEMMGTSSMLFPALKSSDMILANVIVIVLGLLTSILPAWRAASYDPIAALNKT